MIYDLHFSFTIPTYDLNISVIFFYLHQSSNLRTHLLHFHKIKKKEKNKFHIWVRPSKNQFMPSLQGILDRKL